MALATINHCGITYKQTGEVVTVDTNPLAKIMYYLDCVETVAQCGIPFRLRDHKNYFVLSKEEENTVLALASAYAPEVFFDKKIFVKDDALCNSYSNNFLENTNANAQPIILNIGGTEIKTLTIMACNDAWLEKNYYSPKRSFSARICYITAQMFLNKK